MTTFIHKHLKSNNMNNGLNDMTVNDSEMCVRSKIRSLVNTGDISPEIAKVNVW